MWVLNFYKNNKIFIIRLINIKNININKIIIFNIELWYWWMGYFNKLNLNKLKNLIFNIDFNNKFN